jgi:hypothetical protein
MNRVNSLQKRRAAMPKGFRRPMHCACCVQSNWAHIFVFVPEIETMKMGLPQGCMRITAVVSLRANLEEKYNFGTVHNLPIPQIETLLYNAGDFRVFNAC